MDRGIVLAKEAPPSSMAGYRLATLKRDLLMKQGRGQEALDAAWVQHRAHPSKYFYSDFMKYVPKRLRTAWHERAIKAGKGADLDSYIE